jgi:hypothetical protein
MQLNGELFMTEPTPTLSRHDLEAKIVKHCWENEEFRREFTDDPAVAFVKYLEIPAASLPKILIHEEPLGSWHIVLPPRPANTDELPEEDLERIAGGTTPPGALATRVVLSAITGSAVVSGGATVSTYIVSAKEGGW